MPFFALKFSDDDPLFCMSFHPEKAQFVLGSATGRVTCYDYSTEDEAELPVTPREIWTTKRHKGSCRAIKYDQTGQFIVSCGSEGVIKKCDSQSGKVTKKTEVKTPVSAMAINEEYIVVGDERGRVTAFKLDLTEHRKYKLENIDNITSICPLDCFNKHNFAVSGEMHVFRIDVRKDEPVSKSEDQEDEILCGCVASETRSAWGMSEGVLTVWKNKGLGDQQQRVRLTKDGSVDTVVAGEEDDIVYAGTSDGWVAEVNLVSAQTQHRAQHNPEDPEEDVGFMDLDYKYRLVSGSMTLLRVWNTDEIATAEAELQAEKERQTEELEQQRKQKEQGKKGKAKARKSDSKDKSSKKKRKSQEPKAFADLMG